LQLRGFKTSIREDDDADDAPDKAKSSAEEAKEKEAETKEKKKQAEDALEDAEAAEAEAAKEADKKASEAQVADEASEVGKFNDRAAAQSVGTALRDAALEADQQLAEHDLSRAQARLNQSLTKESPALLHGEALKDEAQEELQEKLTEITDEMQKELAAVRWKFGNESEAESNATEAVLHQLAVGTERNQSALVAANKGRVMSAKEELADIEARIARVNMRDAREAAKEAEEPEPVGKSTDVSEAIVFPFKARVDDHDSSLPAEPTTAAPEKEDSKSDEEDGAGHPEKEAEATDNTGAFEEAQAKQEKPPIQAFLMTQDDVLPSARGDPWYAKISTYVLLATIVQSLALKPLPKTNVDKKIVVAFVLNGMSAVVFTFTCFAFLAVGSTGAACSGSIVNGAPEGWSRLFLFIFNGVSLVLATSHIMTNRHTFDECVSSSFTNSEVSGVMRRLVLYFGYTLVMVVFCLSSDLLFGTQALFVGATDRRSLVLTASCFLPGCILNYAVWCYMQGSKALNMTPMQWLMYQHRVRMHQLDPAQYVQYPGSEERSGVNKFLQNQGVGPQKLTSNEVEMWPVSATPQTRTMIYVAGMSLGIVFLAKAEAVTYAEFQFSYTTWFLQFAATAIVALFIGDAEAAVKQVVQLAPAALLGTASAVMGMRVTEIANLSTVVFVSSISTVLCLALEILFLSGNEARKFKPVSLVGLVLICLAAFVHGPYGVGWNTLEWPSHMGLPVLGGFMVLLALDAVYLKNLIGRSGLVGCDLVAATNLACAVPTLALACVYELSDSVARRHIVIELSHLSTWGPLMLSFFAAWIYFYFELGARVCMSPTGFLVAGVTLTVIRAMSWNDSWLGYLCTLVTIAGAGIWQQTSFGKGMASGPTAPITSGQLLVETVFTGAVLGFVVAVL